MKSRRGFFGWIIAALLALVVIGTLAFWAGSIWAGAAPMYTYPAYHFWFFFPFGFLFFFLFIFLILRLVFWRGYRGWGYWGHRRYWGDAKEILRQRYARGEITKDQFEQMLRDLEQHQ